MERVFVSRGSPPCVAKDVNVATMAGERDEEGTAEEPAEAPVSAENEAPEGANEEAAAKVDPEGAEAPAKAKHEPEGAAWGKPLVRLERAWTFVESRLLFVVLMLLVLSMVGWVSLRGLAAPVGTESSAGTVFRALVGSAVLGTIARIAAGRAKGVGETKSAIVTTVAVLVGAAIAPLWRTVGIDRFDGILNWLQEGSNMTMLGGLRGVATRLTLLVALIGASLAAARSKHINIDVVLRFMRPGLRRVVHVLAAIATAAVCFGASWGFLDYISIEGFSQRPDAPAMEKVAGVRRASSMHWFVFRKQIALDLRALPDVVFRGVRWDAPSRMNGQAWNAWLDEAGFAERFSAEELAGLRAPESALAEPRVAIVSLPGENARGVLLQDTNLMWPIGLFLIGLRVLLRALLVVAGHASVEPDADEPDEDDEPRAQAAEEASR